MKIKFKPWEKIQTISWNIWYVNYISIFDWYITYNIWDWNDKFTNMDEWQILKNDDKKQIWFNVEFD